MEDRQKYIDKLVDEDVDAIMTNDTICSGLDQMLRGGNKGYNNMTDDEIEQEYKSRKIPEGELEQLNYDN